MALPVRLCVLYVSDGHVSFLLVTLISLRILYINTRICMTEGKKKLRSHKFGGDKLWKEEKKSVE